MSEDKNWFIEGIRGEPKIIIKDIPCGLCDFVGENIGELMNHFDSEHPLISLWSSSNYENQFKKVNKN